MKKNSLVILIIALLAVGVGTWGFLALRGSVTSSDRDLLSVLPCRPSALLRINHPDDFRRQLLYNNTLWSYWSESGTPSPTRDLMERLDTLSESSPELYARLAGRTWLVAWYLTENDGRFELTPLICCKSSQEDCRVFEPLLARAAPFYSYQEDGITALSTDKRLLDESLSQLPTPSSCLMKDSLFMHLAATANSRVPANLMIDAQGWREAMAPHWQSGKRPHMGNCPNWIVLDWEGSRTRWTLDGFSAQTTSSACSATWDASAFLPQSTCWFHSYSADSTFRLPAENAAWTCPTGESPRQMLQEQLDGGYALGVCPTGSFLMVRLKDGEAASSYLRTLTEGLGGQQRGDVFHYPTTGWLGHLLGNEFTLSDEYLAIQGNCLLIASNPSLINLWKSRLAHEAVFSGTDSYKMLKDGLQSGSHETFYLDLNYLIEHATELFEGDFPARNADYLVQLGAFQTFCLQTDYEPYGMDYRHALLQQTAKGVEG